MMRNALFLARCERGNSAVELALVAPLLSALLVGMVDLSRAYSTKLQLTQAAQRTIERVQQRHLAASNAALIQAEGVQAATAAGYSTSTVTADNWLECNGVRQSSYSLACSPGEAYARYVSVDISYNYRPMFRTRFAGSNADGTYTLRGKAGVRVQ